MSKEAVLLPRPLHLFMFDLLYGSLTSREAVPLKSLEKSVLKK